MSKAQLLELALVKLVEAQRQDLSLPLDDRWAERDSRASADMWAPWLEAESATLQQVIHGLARLRACVEQVRGRGKQVESADLAGVWRKYVPEPIAPRPDCEP